MYFSVLRTFLRFTEKLKMPVAILKIFLFFSICAFTQAYSEEPLAEITLIAGQYPLFNTPVSLTLDTEMAAFSCLRMEEIKNGKVVPVPSQIEPKPKPHLWFIASGSTPPDTTRFYQLRQAQSDVCSENKISVDDKFLDICHGSSKVLRFNHAMVPPPQGGDPIYARSAFIHPLCSPSGQILTQIHPADHLHHLGIWNPWTKTIFDDNEIDFWNLGKGQGTVRFVKLNYKTSGPVLAAFEARKEHIWLKAPEGEKKILDEKLTVRVFNTGDAANGYLIDYIITQRCAGSVPLDLPAYRYGGFGFRATEQWKGKNRNYLTSEGKTIKDADGSRARWCNVFGSTENGPCGVLFMSHPQNHEHPEPIRVWGPEFSDVFFNFCPIKKKSWTFVPQKDYTMKYRMYVYDGQIDANFAERLWQGFACQPDIELKKK
jgi:hypothetical protein